MTQPTISTRRSTRARVAPAAARPAEPALPLPAGKGKVRPFLRRWLTAGMLLGASLLAIFYISNAIAVNDLTATISSLEHEGDVVRRENEKLRAEMLRLMSVERVTSLAAERLGMVQPARPPLALTPAARMEAMASDSAGAE